MALASGATVVRAGVAGIVVAVAAGIADQIADQIADLNVMAMRPHVLKRLHQSWRWPWILSPSGSSFRHLAQSAMNSAQSVGLALKDRIAGLASLVKTGLVKIVPAKIVAPVAMMMICAMSAW